MKMCAFRNFQSWIKLESGAKHRTVAPSSNLHQVIKLMTISAPSVMKIFALIALKKVISQLNATSLKTGISLVAKALLQLKTRV